MKKRKKQSGPGSRYVNIEWDKIATLFAQKPQQEKGQGTYPSARELLHFAAAAGVVGLVLAFPPALTGIAAFIKLGTRDYRRWGMNRVLSRMEKQKYVTIKESPNGATTVIITKFGMRRALTYHLDTLSVQKPKRWDGKWRIVIFDVPEKYKELRDTFRMRLRQLGLYQLQESVYVSPYSCFDQVEFLRELYGIAVTVKYIIGEKIEDDAFLRRHFDLAT